MPWSKYTRDMIQALAQERGGELLSPEWKGVNQTYQWKCQQGHTWSCKGKTVVNNGSWCRVCFEASLTKYTFESVQAIARERGGQLLSTEWTVANRRYEWMCSQGHEWSACGLSVVSTNTWCGVCAVEATKGRTGLRKYTMADADALAASRGGRCLSVLTSFTSGATALCWSCHEGHMWSTVFSSIRRGSWCRVCACRTSERICRQILEFLYQAPFPTVRPRWAKSPLSNNPLELDCYNESLQLALEFQGAQHESVCDFFGTDEEKLEKIKLRDAAKVTQCEERRVNLIVVPHTVKQEDLYTYIRERCPALPAGTPETKSLSDFERVGHGEDRLKTIRTCLPRNSRVPSCCPRSTSRAAPRCATGARRATRSR